MISRTLVELVSENVCSSNSDRKQSIFFTGKPALIAVTTLTRYNIILVDLASPSPTGWTASRLIAN